MAITKNIVDIMGVTIDVTSEVDHGTLFRVELEFRIPEGRADRQFWEKNRISSILLVDGDAESAENIQVLMKDTGIHVDTASGEEEALRHIREYHRKDSSGEESQPRSPEGSGGNDSQLQSLKGYCGYDLILLDWNGADLGIAHTAEKLRETIPYTVPILFLVSYDDTRIEEALRIENTEMLAKPFFVSAFKEKIMEMQNDKQEETAPEGAEDVTLEGLHFLAAEDNEINAEILQEILSIEGAGCEVVENGQMAIERFSNAAEGEFDAILMDVQMPVMNGYDATRAIRVLERKDARTIPIIAMTANAFAEDEKEALDAGMNVHLAKPIDIDLLKKVIKQCIKKTP